MSTRLYVDGQKKRKCGTGHVDGWLTLSQVKQLLYEFQNLHPSDSDFLPSLENLMENLKHHIKEEEEHDLIKLEEALSGTESQQLSAKFERTKSFTPTRSHPDAPNKPPFETVAGLMAAPLDKLGDLLRSFPKDDASAGKRHDQGSSSARL
jgi:hypothetical protein